MILTILPKIDKTKLVINPIVHERTWDFYIAQYKKALTILFEGTIVYKGHINIMCHAFMFIFRHTIELMLKKYAEEKGTKLGDSFNSHNFNEILSNVECDKQQFLKNFEDLSCDTEGDCWRYPYDTSGLKYFNLTDCLDIVKCCRAFSIFCAKYGYAPLKNCDFRSKKLANELRLYVGQSSTLGQFATEYDFAITELLEAIDNDVISTNDIYLPLIFLIRHSLELKLKQAILNLGNIVSEKEINCLNNEHSVTKLYRILAKFTDNAIAKLSDTSLQKESDKLNKITIKFKDLIQSIDANAQILRFPKDRLGNQVNFIPQKNTLLDLIELYQMSDTFLCFVIDVMLNAGTIDVGDDILSAFFE